MDFRIGGGHIVRKARINLQGSFLQDLRGHETRSADRHDLIVIAMHHQHGNVGLLQVLGEIGFRERLESRSGP
jgi:hypothetical protein